ncbi:MAG TPA: non-ribosomal peptide synthetase, partial [Deltaproteobacteria bacterium]|nr:non-ribosomal peptide synthetase [Deltaproteobacteria bacterium]
DLILAEARTRAALSMATGPVCLLEDAVAAGRGLTCKSESMDDQQAAYVIYTSGSTGRPKGVVVEYRQVARLLTACAAEMDLTSADVWSCCHSAAFDFPVWEIWGALAHGARVVLLSAEITRDPAALRDELRERQVTVLSQTPSSFGGLVAADMMRSAPWKLRYIIFGGEALRLDMLRPWGEQHGLEQPALINMYGITETTVHVTAAHLTMQDLAAAGSWIGGPLRDLDLWVLDHELRPLAAGCGGELYVGGAGVARGYLNQPGRTAERFLPHPWRSGERLYRTGDKVVCRPDGTLEYLGRLDSQVQIRGHRVELGEIEAALRDLPAVQDAVVVANPVEGGSSVGAVVGYLASDAAPESSWREALAARLPHYMVPDAFVVLPRLPLTPNGKVDRRALPAPDRPEVAYEEPEGAMESRVAEIWSDVLSLERVGRSDDFFSLGGHSLRAAQIIARLREETGVELSTAVFFTAATVRGVALALEEGQTSTTDNLDRISALLDELDDEDD